MKRTKIRQLRDLYTKNFKTTWYVKKWNNVDKDGSDINNPPFGGTELIKGLFGKLLFGIGHSWEIHMVIGNKEYKSPESLIEALMQYRALQRGAIFGANTSKGVHTTKLPYHRRKLWKNRSIMLDMDERTLEKLCKDDVKKFKCTMNIIMDCKLQRNYSVIIKKQ